MEHSTSECPGCKTNQHELFLTVKDHFLTKENFDLILCGNCRLLFTNPRPPLESIGDYYKSEEYVSHSSTKKGFINRVYGWVRSYTLKKKVALVQELTLGRELLDIGAGTGHFLAAAKKSGFKVTGLEPDPDARNVASTLHNIELDDLDRLHKLPENVVDVVTMWHVLEHVYDLNEDLAKISSLIKKNGVLIVAVPNYTSFDASYYQSNWAAYDVPRHLYHFSPESIVPLIEKYGLKFVKQLPMKFDSYYVAMLSEKYQGGSILNAIRIGWLSNLRSKNGKCSSQIYVFRQMS